MICPNCLAELEFVMFDVDAQTLEHRGIFHCQCSDGLILSEAETKDTIGDEDLKDQIRQSRLLRLRLSLQARDPAPVSVQPGIIQIHTRHLKRYLEYISDQSLRLLK